jgi:hypothetical protein
MPTYQYRRPCDGCGHPVKPTGRETPGLCPTCVEIVTTHDLTPGDDFDQYRLHDEYDPADLP